MREHHEQNRRSWNSVTPIHNAHKRDQASFLRNGGSTLFDEELELTGDLEGRRLLHLQCNCGQDSLSLASRGAIVTGVDIADSAIEFAQGLVNETGIDARFERADVLEWLPAAAARGERFDLVFSTYGTIGWISDLSAWARGVAGVLDPGGRIVLLELHPMVWAFDKEFKPIDDYFGHGPIHESEGVTDYVGQSGDSLTPSGRVGGAAEEFANPEASVAFQWTVADTLQALIDAGLRIEIVREYPFTNGCRIWDAQPELPGRRFGGLERELPLMLGVRACRSS